MRVDPIGFLGGINFYSYCLNDPVNWIDPWGLGPNDKFVSLQDAVEDARDTYWQMSVNSGREVGAPIYQDDDGKWYYPEPKWGTEDSVDIVYYPKKIKAWWHSHHKGCTNCKSYKFSPQDESISNNEKVPGYMFDPKGKIHVYLPPECK